MFSRLRQWRWSRSGKGMADLKLINYSTLRKPDRLQQQEMYIDCMFSSLIELSNRAADVRYAVEQHLPIPSHITDNISSYRLDLWIGDSDLCVEVNRIGGHLTSLAAALDHKSAYGSHVVRCTNTTVQCYVRLISLLGGDNGK